MKKEKSAKKEPLLYIQQPKLENVKANMQVTYRSSKAKPKEVKPVEEMSSSKKENSSYQRKIGTEEPYQDEKEFKKSTNEKDEEIAQNTSSKEEKFSGASAFRKVKPFKELSIDEKLDYISESISGKVPFPCEFSTEESSHKGVMTNDAGNEITIKTFQGEEFTIKRSALKSIKMIGLH
ncbi:CotO family spore coat protein [Rossellomorea aquimaris]|uniref:CotO family spore coat protein n=1 Tax=Rossellomorea aquimaris TaxID=189382 RepID=UPI0007D07C1A|nr:CotO family spore coat protein [Rossellomorea aquimaris]